MINELIVSIDDSSSYSGPHLLSLRSDFFLKYSINLLFIVLSLVLYTSSSFAGVTVGGTSSAGGGLGVPSTSTSSIPGTSSGSPGGGSLGTASSGLGGPAIPTVPAGLVPSLDNLADSARALAEAAPDVANAGRALANATDKLAQQLGDSAESAGDAVRGFTEMGYGVIDMLGAYQDLIRNQSSAWRGTIDGASESINALSGALQSLSDPKRMAGVAAAAAFAGTLASTIASQVPKLLFDGATAIQEAITHSKRNALDASSIRAILGEYGQPGQYQIVEDRQQSLIRMITAGLGLLEIADRIQKEKPSGTESTSISTWIVEDMARLRTRQDVLKGEKEKAGGDQVCLLDLNRELIQIEQEIRPMDEALQKYSEQYRVLDGKIPTQQICSHLDGIWSSISDAEVGLQNLRGRVLASQTSFLKETLKEFRSVRKDFDRGREGLSQDRSLRREANGDYLPGSSESKAAARLMKDQLNGMKIALTATEEDISDQIETCIKSRIKEVKKSKGSQYELIDMCKQDVLKSLMTGDYGKEREEIYSRFSAFSGSLAKIRSQQEDLIRLLHPANEIEQAYLLGKANQFMRVALDQSSIKDRYAKLSELESRFIKACSDKIPPGREKIFK